MKILLLPVLALFTITSYAQDSLKINQIDSQVKLINQSNFQVQYDSIIQDYPDLGLNMRTYLTMITDGKEIKKYVNKVHSVRQEKGKTVKMVSTNEFYFDKNKLIKVEEFAVSESKEARFDWYFADDKPLYYTLQSEKAASRAALLLTMGEGMVKQVQEKIK